MAIIRGTRLHQSTKNKRKWTTVWSPISQAESVNVPTGSLPRGLGRTQPEDLWPMNAEFGKEIPKALVQDVYH